MKVLHISAECYPAAKAGGLGDVVGALPKYQNLVGLSAAVVMPKYDLPWVRNRSTHTVFSDAFYMGNDYFYPFSIELAHAEELGFPLYLVHLPGQFDRQGIYGDNNGWFSDNAERFVFFQQAVLKWVASVQDRPDILHCHDHHAGLIPFMAGHCPEYQSLSGIRTVFTIHNGEYQGGLTWDKAGILPYFPPETGGLLEWDGAINPLASAIKCAWAVTTVSQSYMEELALSANGLEGLFRSEWTKCLGILNGIDAQVWDPKTDPWLPTHLGDDLADFKWQNKQALLQRFHFQPASPVFTFIGRLVREKGADLLPGLITQVLDSGLAVNFLILGTGEPDLHEQFKYLNTRYPGRFQAILEYNEGLAHQLYAGSDFLLMPSRVEPCGLNQMYAMRYGTVPIVRSVGGLRDTVSDLSESPQDGRGFRFEHLDPNQAHQAIWKAFQLYHSPDGLDTVRHRILNLDFSWQHAAHNYTQLYRALT